MPTTRPAAVAGRFYPADPSELEAAVEAHLAHGDADRKPPKAAIAPHAGYVYSGDVAGHAFATLRRAADQIRRVVLIGPAHHVRVDGLAISGADSFETPLGEVAVDAEARSELIDAGLVEQLDEPHAPEHSLETHLPFLQKVVGDFEIVPIVTGLANPEQVAQVLDKVWGAEETF
ncbi:MAG: AmmeMemoRadiSam system protein B, partial [Persicimonas sp.]